MITVSGIDVRGGARLLLSGISFRVSPGDRVGPVGRNGAGKTTLLNALTGTLRPAAGTVTRTGGVGHLHQDSRAAPRPRLPHRGPGRGGHVPRRDRHGHP